MKAKDDYLIFSTGKKIYANCDMYSDDLSKAEKEELADYMIDLWLEFKAYQSRDKRKQ